MRSEKNSSEMRESHSRASFRRRPRSDRDFRHERSGRFAHHRRNSPSGQTPSNRRGMSRPIRVAFWRHPPRPAPPFGGLALSGILSGRPGSSPEPAEK